MDYTVEDIKSYLEDIYEHLDQIGPDIAGLENALKERGYKYTLYSLRDKVEETIKELADTKEEIDDFLKEANESMKVVNESATPTEQERLYQIMNDQDGVYIDVADSDEGPFYIVDGWESIANLYEQMGWERHDEYDTEELDRITDGNWGFSDEWGRCDNCNKLVRTTADSYSWVAKFFVNENGELLCEDCVKADPTEYIESIINKPTHANTILSEDELINLGFTKITEDLENGWYDKQDDHEELLNKALNENPDGEFIFNITSAGQWATDFELWGRGLITESLKESKTLNEDDEDLDDDEVRIKALADYLEIDPDEIKKGYTDHYYELNSGEEYYVLTEQEAYNLEKDYIMDLIDDMGVFELFGENAMSLIDGNVDQDWFEEAEEESFRGYMEDLDYESSNTFDSRLVEEMFDDGVLFDEDFLTVAEVKKIDGEEEDIEEGDDEAIDYMRLRPEVDMKEKKEQFLSNHMKKIDDFAEDFKLNSGGEEFDKVVREYNLVDTEAVAEECISWDGVGHNIAGYDGRELDLENGFYAYRNN